MRPMLIVGCALSLAACAKGGEQAGGGMMVNLADYAGTWNAQSLAEGSDSVLVSYTINATATPDGWTVVLPGRDPMPMHVMTMGDSVMTHTDPFESVLRAGVQVSTDATFRLVNGQIEGWIVAHYQGAGADSVLRQRLRATRAP